MATTTITTYTLNITFGTSYLEGVGDEITWKLDNPKDNLTYTEVSNLFADPNNGIFTTCEACNADGELFTAVKKAQTVHTVKTVEDLPE